jgi:acyl transferase domain-containing protein
MTFDSFDRSSFKDVDETQCQNHEQELLALVGIGCRFPGGVRNAESFWNLIASGTSAITEVPADRWNADRYYHAEPLATERMVTKWGGFVDQLKDFDASFWGVSPREAMRMDPQQRWLLEAAWEAIEDAGIPPASLRGSTTGVFVGISAADYLTVQLSDKHHIDVHTNSGGTLSIAANRVSYMLDLRGPSVAVDTACSSALVAVSLACQAIWSGKCDGALAGGANALISPNSSIGFSKAGMLSPSGQCFAFDERANGYVRGEGAGLVYLKTLSRAQRDGDHIYAVVRSAVVNSDGHTSSMTVPGMESQVTMLRQAYREAGIRPQDVDYVEAHGTGTPVGDPIESEALGRVLGAGRADDNKCLMGSVKTNIGHLESGSGIAGMIKAALVLDHRMIPPNQNFKTPNPRIPFNALGLEVVKELRPLLQREGRLPVASVNSFGFGGTNAHIVMEAAPLPLVRTRTTTLQPEATRPFVLPVSARDKTALRDFACAYTKLLSDPTMSLGDVCYSAGTHKEHHSERLVVIADDKQQMRDQLQRWLDSEEHLPGAIVGQSRDASAELFFVFTGQGSQWWGMGQQLLQREPLFRKTIETMDALFRELSGWSIIDEMVKSEDQSQIDHTVIAQPAICALQIGLAELWKSWGIVPTGVVGHSVGEVAAAYCAGALTLEDTVRVIYHRSRLQDTTAGHGRMLAAGINPREAREMIGDLADRIHITAINSPGLVTLGGDSAPLELIAARLEREGRFMRWLKVNYAFHTHQMDPIRDQLLDSLASIRPQAGNIPFVSTVTGGIYPGERLNAMYWWHNVRRPVLFEPAIKKSIQLGATVFLEVGAHPSMQSSLTDCLVAQKVEGKVLHSLSRRTDESLQMLSNLAQLHFCSAKINWSAVNQSAGQLVKLPSYPWQYESYWLDRGDLSARLLPIRHQFLQRRLSAARPTWQFDADLRVFSYLQDHRLWDGVVFPAAGFAEIGLAIARELFPEEPYAVEELELLKALFVSQDIVPTIQVTFDQDDRSFHIFSKTDEKQDWELHASGRLVLVSSEIRSAEPVDLAQIRERIRHEVTHEQLYAELGLMGYQFGPTFSQIEQIWCEPGESLAKIVAPLSIAESSAGYRFHPAILDACFQATHSTREVMAEIEVPDFFFLPESIRRVQLYQANVPQQLWAHAKLRQRDARSLLCDIFVYDEHGNRVADVLGFRAVQVEHKRSADGVETGLYQFRWEELPLGMHLPK